MDDRAGNLLQERLNKEGRLLVPLTAGWKTNEATKTLPNQTRNLAKSLVCATGQGKKWRRNAFSAFCRVGNFSGAMTRMYGER